MRKGGLDQLRAVLDDATALVARCPADEPDLLASLRHVYFGLFLADFAAYEVADVRTAGPDLRHQLLDMQLGLRDSVPLWAEHGYMTHAVQVALRDVFRVARYAREIIAEIEHDHERLGPRETVEMAFGGPADFLEVNPRFCREPVELKPGDVLLQRGRLHNSAAIARIGNVDSQFSHVAVVARGTDGAPVTVEALIEDGSVVLPLETALRDGVARAILFRHRDQELAVRASEMIRDAVLEADGRTRPRMLYDFSMEMAGYHQLFCAKLVRLAYSMASTGEYRLPTFATVLDMRNRDFVSRIGVTAVETFAPGDMELEPDFDLVAEWHDYRVTSELRLKDMIMTKLFEWMDRHDYRFRPRLGIRLVARLGRLSSYMPSAFQDWLRGRVGKVPPNMPASAIGAVAMLHKTAEELYLHLADLERQTIERTGRQLHPREVLEALERMRLELGDRIGYLERAG